MGAMNTSKLFVNVVEQLINSSFCNHCYFFCLKNVIMAVYLYTDTTLGCLCIKCRVVRFYNFRNIKVCFEANCQVISDMNTPNR